MTHTPLFWCCFIALLIDALVVWTSNAYLYPRYVGIFPEARGISSIAGIATFVFFAVWSIRWPDRLNEPRITAINMLLYVLSVLLVSIGLLWQSAPILVIGSAVRGVSTRWFVLLMFLSLCKLEAKSCMICITGSVVASYCIRPLLAMTSESLVLIFLSVAPFFVYLLVRPYAVQVIRTIQESQPAQDVSVTQPSSYLPFSHVFFLAISAFRVAFGLALTLGSFDGNPPDTLLPVIPLLALFVLAWVPHIPKADVLYGIAALLIIAGWLFVIIQAARDIPVDVMSSAFLYAGSECFNVLVVFALASIGSRNISNALAVCAWGRAASSAGLLLGAAMGHAFNAIADLPSIAYLLAIALLLFFAFNLFALKDFSFQKTIDGVKHVEDVSSIPMVANDMIEQRCTEFSERFGLTPRETQIAELLAHGRNGPYIQQELHLSRNTVKTHVSHIYTKLDIHSQQELIDLATANEQ